MGLLYNTVSAKQRRGSGEWPTLAAVAPVADWQSFDNRALVALVMGKRVVDVGAGGAADVATGERHTRGRACVVN